MHPDTLTLPARKDQLQPNITADFNSVGFNLIPAALPAPVPALLEPAPDWAKFQPTLDLPTRHGLTELKRQIAEDDQHKWDLIVPKDRLALSQGLLTLPEEHLDEHPESLSLSPWATAQVCQRLGIPVDYFKKLSRPLRDANVNHWLWRQDAEPDDENTAQSGGPRSWLLRCKGEGVRAVLSDRYRPLDNADLIGTLIPILEDRFEVRGIALTPESFHLRLVDPRLAREVLPNDRLMVGVHVANSETGRRSVTVDALVWRLVCLNGLVRLVRGKSLLRQRHVSWDRPRFADALSRAVCEAVTAGAGLIDRLQAATREPVPDVEGMIRAIGQQAALTQAVQDRVKQALLGTPPSQAETVYGLVQALTYTAQSLSPDDRYDLEVTAGRLLDEGLPSPIKADISFLRRSQNGRMLGG
jgi:hypothetical protein